MNAANLNYPTLKTLTEVTIPSLIFCSLVDTYSDGIGHLDFRRSQFGSGMSKNAQVVINRGCASEIFYIH